VLPHNAPLQVSVVIPVYNEEANVAELVERVGGAMRRAGKSFELICIDDGSRDHTAAKLEALATERPWLKPLYLIRNYGQSAALQAGFDAAQGEVIVTLDGDLQNDPDDVPGLGDVGGGGHEEDPAVAADPHRRERRLRLRARLDGNQGSVIHGGEVARTTRRRVTPLGDAPFARSLEPSQRPDAGGPASSDHVTSGSCRRDSDRAVEPFILRASSRDRTTKESAYSTHVVLRTSSRSHRGACSP